MKMLNESYLQGVRSIVCTSHETAYDEHGEKVMDAFEELKCLCASEMEDLKLYLGCEIYIEPGVIDSIIEDLEYEYYPSMNGTKYVLIEFPTKGICFEQIKKCVEKLQHAGWKPVIAHAERYADILNGIKDIRALKEMGCLIQVNAYSILEESYIGRREFANEILDARLIDMIGSDAHRMNIRPPRMLKGAKEIYRRCDKEYADAICFKNAQKYFELAGDER